MRFPDDAQTERERFLRFAFEVAFTDVQIEFVCSLCMNVHHQVVPEWLQWIGAGTGAIAIIFYGLWRACRKPRSHRPTPRGGQPHPTPILSTELRRQRRPLGVSAQRRWPDAPAPIRRAA